VHLVIWCKQTDQRVHLLFSVTALLVSTAASAIGVQTGRMRPEVAAALVFHFVANSFRRTGGCDLGNYFA